MFSSSLKYNRRHQIAKNRHDAPARNRTVGGVDIHDRLYPLISAMILWSSTHNGYAVNIYLRVFRTCCSQRSCHCHIDLGRQKRDRFPLHCPANTSVPSVSVIKWSSNRGVFISDFGPSSSRSRKPRLPSVKPSEAHQNRPPRRTQYVPLSHAPGLCASLPHRNPVRKCTD